MVKCGEGHSLPVGVGSEDRQCLSPSHNHYLNSADLHQFQEHSLDKVGLWGGYVHPSPPRGDAPAGTERMCHLDAIMAVVEQLTSTNATQDRVNTVIDHVVSADWRQRVTLHSTTLRHSIHSTIYSPRVLSFTITKPKWTILSHYT